MLIAVVVIVIGLVVFWYAEQGRIWALAILAAIPLLGLAMWLKQSPQQRADAATATDEALQKSALGRGWQFFIRVLYVFAALVILSVLVNSLTGNGS